MLLVSKKHLKVDEVRRGVEALEPEVYAGASYYEKWAGSVASILLERQLLSHEEMGRELGEEDSPDARFAVGDAVRVKQSSWQSRWRRPHLRTPGFVHGVCGTVEALLGAFDNPEQLAFGGKSWGKCQLYRVRFEAQAIQDFDAGEAGHDQVTVEIYQSWLEKAEVKELEQRKRHLPAAHADCKRAKHHEGHEHEERLVVEQRAVDEELPCPLIARVLISALQKKGLIQAEELQQAIEKLEQGEQRLGEAGRKVVAHAWVDEKFKARLLEEGNAACLELGVNAVNPTAPTRLVVFEQTPKEHHLIVCTLCSCYPLTLLGLSPDWYKSREYRSRAVREPRAVLKEFGTLVPKEMQVIVHDSTADCRYMILPRRPEGTEGWSEEQLQEIITRDSMIGVTNLPESV